jgi:CBS domain-containing protein
VPREEWKTRTVRDAAVACTPDTTVAAGADALDALTKMSRSGTSRMLVVDGDRLVGVLTMKDLLDFFALKMDLER